MPPGLFCVFSAWTLLILLVIIPYLDDISVVCSVSEDHVYVVRKWGSYAEIHSMNRVVSSKPKSLRGSVSGASDKSRRRLVGAIFKSKAKLRFLTTLTYEDSIPSRLSGGGSEKLPDLQEQNSKRPTIPRAAILEREDFRPLKKDIQAMLRWLERRGVRALWFLEFTKSGRPHWHLMTESWLDCGWRKVVRKGREVEVSKYEKGHKDFVDQWVRLTNQKNNRFHKGGITEKLLSEEGAARYASKEASKRAQKNAPNGAITGRMWGMPREWSRPHDSEEKITLKGEPMFSRIYNVSSGIPIRPGTNISYVREPEKSDKNKSQS